MIAVRTRARNSRRARAAVVAAAIACGGFGAARAQPLDTAPVPPAELEPHMLEDPFNRSLSLDRLETRNDDGGDLVWDARFWAGRAFDKLALRTRGEKRGATTERAELELLWAHAVAPWWELVAGARADFAPGSSRTWAAFGVQGLAPYRFELEATAYLGDGGDTAARIEGEYELLITPRLILQPQVELEWHGQSDRVRGIGAGFSSAATALRLRYEMRRELAPYVGLVRERRFGRTADLLRSIGREADDTQLAAGIRLRF